MEVITALALMSIYGNHRALVSDHVINLLPVGTQKSQYIQNIIIFFVYN